MTIVCLNGDFLPLHEAYLPISDRGFMLGDGLFETIRVSRGQPRHLTRHLARLKQGLSILRIAGLDLEEVRQNILDLCGHNNSVEAVVRLTVSRGGGPRGLLPEHGLKPTWVATTHPLRPVLTPAKLAIASDRKAHNTLLSQVKHTNYLTNIIARMEAHDAGCDDAILLTSSGLVAETCVANIIALFETDVITPPLSDGALPGVSRARLIEGKLCREASFSLNALRDADAVWLSTSLSLRPVGQIDGQTIPHNNELTSQLDHFLFADDVCKS